MKSTLFLLTLILTIPLCAQIDVPPKSPTFELKGSVGFADVQVVYSRPSARGREVMGNLIPAGEVWRTGANASTKISFSEEVVINENTVPAGDYALYTIFNEETATIIFSKNLTWWGSLGYDESDDLLRFDVPVKHPSSHYETFTISFSDITQSSANLNMKWGKTKAMFNISMDIDAKITAQIQEQLIDGSTENLGAYYQGAAYYYDTDRDASLALGWIEKVIEGSEKELYWNYHLKAKLLAKLGKKKDCIKTAKKSIELATAAGNPDYIKLNQQLIESVK